MSTRVAGVGWLLWTTAEFLRAFVERIFANFCDKNIVFTFEKNRRYVVVKGLNYTDTVPQTPVEMFLKISSSFLQSFYFMKAL